MVENLYENITTGLNAVNPSIVYQETVPEHSVRPYFLISLGTLESAAGINGRLKHTASIDISYVPQTSEDKLTECWKVGQDLLRTFQTKSFKIKNRKSKITDQVLHFTFDADYREYFDPLAVKMQTMSQNTNMKED